MILILKRDDLPPEHSQRALASLELEHSGLLPEFIKHAELIVFVEGKSIKFLKDFTDFQSKASLEVLIGYITSTVPTTYKPIPFSKKRIQYRR